MKHFRSILSAFLFFLLYFFNWKKQVVFANYLYIYSDSSLKNANTFYKNILKKLSRQAIDFLTYMTPFKNAPNKMMNYPFYFNDLKLEIDKSSCNTINKMKAGDRKSVV